MNKKTMIATLLLGGIILLTGCSKVSLTNSNNSAPSGDISEGAPSNIISSDEQPPVDDSQLPPTPPSEN